MRVPLSWLREYIDIALPTVDLAKALTMAGLEVESIEETPIRFENVVVGKVLECQKHPDAEKLTVATVSDGKERYQVVCGAPNCRAGMKTAFALVGATLEDDKGQSFKIKKAKLRGVESFGMLCAADELGLSRDHDGIMDLPQEMTEGTSLASYFGDTILEIAITPNLGHCSSVFGIARELSAILGLPLNVPEFTLQESEDPIDHAASVVVADKKLCPRYTCRVIKGVKVGPSPAWLKRRLEQGGIRSINNVVDVTNYVLLELGQPLHAFDYDEIAGHLIDVRPAREGEPFVTLDEVSRVLPEGTLLICDEKKPVAIAGIMGGQNSEVTSDTVNILLESAYFDPKAIRRASKKLGLTSDSSKRFEKGCDPNNVIVALNRAAALLQEVAGGHVLKGIIDVKEAEFKERAVSCRLSRVNKLLGTKLGMSEVEKIFQQLRFPYLWDQKDTFTVQVPTYRVDIGIEADLIEEVARVYGYNHIPREHAHYQTALLSHAPSFHFERSVRQRLIAEGLQEFLTTDLISPSLCALLPEEVVNKETIIKVLNPTSIEQSILRPSLMPELLKVVKNNCDHQVKDVCGFEVGRVHRKQGDQYLEQLVAGIVMSGRRAPHCWDCKDREVDFYDLKGIIENMLTEMGIEGFAFRRSSLSNFHGGRQAAISVGVQEVGVLGEIHPSIQRRLDVPQRIFFAEIDLESLFKLKKDDRRMRELSLYPSSERDWTIPLSEQTPIEDVFLAIRQVASPLLEEVSLLDIYRSDKLGNDAKNVTFRFVYRDRSKTIEQAAVDKEHAKIIEGTVGQLQK